jgi:hypothetical protein
MDLRRWKIAGFCALALAAFLGLGIRAADDSDAPTPEAKEIDKDVYPSLRGIINRGADLYNGGDVAACYRLYEGALMALRAVLKHRPELGKAIDDGFVNADKDPVVWRRAFVLRNVLDKIRSELKPKKDKAADSDSLKPIEKKDADKKKDDKKEADKKKTDKKTDDKLKDDKKKDEDKADESSKFKKDTDKSDDD